MSYDNLKEIRGKSLEDCKKQLRNLYNKSFMIKDFKNGLRPGFFRMIPYVKVFYKVLLDDDEDFDEESKKSKKPTQNFQNYQKNLYGKFGTTIKQNPQSTFSLSSADEWDKNRNAILGNSSVTQVMQISNVEKKLEETTSTINSKIDVLLKNMQGSQSHDTVLHIEKILRENDFSSSFIESITERICNEFTFNELGDFEAVSQKVVEWIGNSIKTVRIYTQSAPQVIAIVGPTGVGKTTSIVKLATRILIDAKEQNFPRPEIRMITIDKMRTGAVEQLKKYADILNVQLDYVDSSSRMEEIFSECKDSAQFILIDTGGFSPNDLENLSKMKKLLDIDGLKPQIFLAFDASKTAETIKTIMKNFAPFDYNALIITKCDESRKFGQVLSAVIEENKAIAYITDGQSAHENFYKANKIYFLKKLLDFKFDNLRIEDLFSEENNGRPSSWAS